MVILQLMVQSMNFIIVLKPILLRPLLQKVNLFQELLPIKQYQLRAIIKQELVQVIFLKVEVLQYRRVLNIMLLLMLMVVLTEKLLQFILDILLLFLALLEQVIILEVGVDMHKVQLLQQLLRQERILHHGQKKLLRYHIMLMDVELLQVQQL